MDYFYGGTAVCYKDLWQKSTSQNYNNDCQLPRSFSHFPILPSSEEPLQGQNPSNFGAHVTINSIGRHLRDKNQYLHSNYIVYIFVSMYGYL